MSSLNPGHSERHWTPASFFQHAGREKAGFGYGSAVLAMESPPMPQIQIFCIRVECPKGDSFVPSWRWMED